MSYFLLSIGTGAVSTSIAATASGKSSYRLSILLSWHSEKDDIFEVYSFIFFILF